MQYIKQSDLYSILPQSYQSVESECISYALSKAIEQLYNSLDRISVTSNIDNLDEELLDVLAVELRSQYYSSDLTREQKVSIIKGTLLWYMHNGTTKSVEDVLSAIYNGVQLKEWYQYGGEPYHFYIRVNSGDNINLESIDKIKNVINNIKNARSILDNISLSKSKNLKYYQAVKSVSTRYNCCSASYNIYDGNTLDIVNNTDLVGGNLATINELTIDFNNYY